jgi:hypothetical protein
MVKEKLLNGTSKMEWGGQLKVALAALTLLLGLTLSSCKGCDKNEPPTEPSEDKTSDTEAGDVGSGADAGNRGGDTPVPVDVAPDDVGNRDGDIPTLIPATTVTTPAHAIVVPSPITATEEQLIKDVEKCIAQLQSDIVKFEVFTRETGGIKPSTVAFPEFKNYRYAVDSMRDNVVDVAVELVKKSRDETWAVNAGDPSYSAYDKEFKDIDAIETSAGQKVVALNSAALNFGHGPDIDAWPPSVKAYSDLHSSGAALCRAMVLLYASRLGI